MPEPGEFARIAAIVAGLPRGEGVVVGPGDDAAVLRPREGHDLVASTDTFVEGRHFRRELLSPAEVGVRLAAANLSDFAAMAAEPRWALVSLVVGAGWSTGECEALELACARALAAGGAAVVGGNLASGDGPLVATVTLLGECPRARVWTRSGARPGDMLAVTGVPGSAAAAMALALAAVPPAWARVPAELRRAYGAPTARVRVARALAGAGGVRAAIDLSDGLTRDLAPACRRVSRCARRLASSPPRRARTGPRYRPARPRSSRTFEFPRATTTNCCSRSTPPPGRGFRPRRNAPARRSRRSARRPPRAACGCATRPGSSARSRQAGGTISPGRSDGTSP